MKKILTCITMLLITFFFTTNIFGINVRLLSKKYYTETGKIHESINFPVIIYFTKEAIYESDPQLEYIGYIIVYDINKIIYIPKTNNEITIEKINYSINYYSNVNEGTYSVPAGEGIAKSWNALYILLLQIIHSNNIYFLHITTGKNSYDSFIPQYKIKDKDDYNITYTLLNPLSNMLTVEYFDMPDDFSDLFSNMPHEKEGNLK